MIVAVTVAEVAEVAEAAALPLANKEDRNNETLYSLNDWPSCLKVYPSIYSSRMHEMIKVLIVLFYIYLKKYV